MSQRIPFNIPVLTGNENDYIVKALQSGKLAAKGEFTKKCTTYFRERWGFERNLLTTSCTSALELASIVSEIGPGDEVIVPSYTFVSTANAFVLRGAEIRFADSLPNHPNIDVQHAISLINEKTKAIIVVHYAGMAVDMDPLMEAAKKHDIIIIEDAAQAITVSYKGRPLGGIGHFGALSFHETKNITCGEAGLFTVNDERFIRRAEIVHELGTNRSAFLRGEVDRYTWVDVGSSFFPSDVLAAMLWAQLNELENIQEKRISLWNTYHEKLSKSDAVSRKLALPEVPAFSTNNAHTYYLVANSEDERNDLIDYLSKHGVQAVFHYQALHNSPFYRTKNPAISLPNAERYTKCLVRLPLYYDLNFQQTEYIAKLVISFCEG